LGTHTSALGLPVGNQTLIVDKKLRATTGLFTVGTVQPQGFQQTYQQPIQYQQPQYQQFQQQQFPVETHVRPTILELQNRPERQVEIQPIIHREVDAPEVHVIEKHIYERVPSAGPSVINKPTIVQETINPRIIEEIQPVVHRQVPQAYVERVEQHITEHVVQPTVMTKEVINATQQGQFMQAGGQQQQFMPAGGPLQQQQQFNNTASNIPPPPPMPTTRTGGVSSSSARTF